MKGWIVGGIVGVAIISWVGLRLGGEKEEAAKQKDQQAQRRGQNPAVEVYVAGPREILTILEAVGTAESVLVQRVSPRVGGRVAEVLVREGDRVAPNQLLARIDPQETNAAVVQQRAEVAEAQSRLVQAELTAGANEVGLRASVRRREAALERAQAELNQIQKTTLAQIASAQAQVDQSKSRLDALNVELENAEAEIRAAKARRDNAKSRYERSQKLMDEGFASRQQMEDLRTQFEAAQADLDVATGDQRSAGANAATGRAQLTSTEKQLAIVRENAQADLIAARARVTEARADLDEARANQSEAPAYRANLNALRANVRAAEAQLQQADVRRRDTELRATLAGIVTSRTADPGSIASPGQPFLVVQTLDPLYVTASLPVDQASRIAVGQTVRMQFEGVDQRVEGRIEKVNRAADPQSRQFRIVIRVENPDERLRPGMFAQLEVVLARRSEATVIPIEAVAPRDGQETVAVLDAEDKVTYRPVKTSSRDKTGVAIVQGVRPGERVIVLSYSPVRDGQNVRVASIRTPDGKSTPVAPPARREGASGPGDGPPKAGSPSGGRP